MHIVDMVTSKISLIKQKEESIMQSIRESHERDEAIAAFIKEGIDKASSLGETFQYFELGKKIYFPKENKSLTIMLSDYMRFAKSHNMKVKNLCDASKEDAKYVALFFK